MNLGSWFTPDRSLIRDTEVCSNVTRRSDRFCEEPGANRVDVAGEYVGTVSMNSRAIPSSPSDRILSTKDMEMSPGCLDGSNLGCLRLGKNSG